MAKDDDFEDPELEDEELDDELDEDLEELVLDDDAEADGDDLDDDAEDVAVEEDEELEEDDDDEIEEDSLDVLLTRDQGLSETELAREEAREGLGLTTVPPGEGEFTCRSCFLVKRRAQLADEKQMICFDCA